MSAPPLTAAPGTPGGDGPRARRFGPREIQRVVAAALAVAVVVVLVIVLTGGSKPYIVHARFADAGQLVKGGLVEVGGVKIGSIKKIEIVDGQADVEMSITDQDFAPFRRGTTARIRSVGQATITNRYVAINPAPDDAPDMGDGSTLAATDTNGIVDLDAILSSVDPKTRANLRGLFANGAAIYAGSGAPKFNAMLAKLNPSLAQVNELTGELAQDRAAVGRLARTGATTAKAVAERSPQLQQAITGSATAFRAIADQRTALASALDRAPGTLDLAGRVLRNAAGTATSLRPTLRAVPASQARLRLLLRRAPKALNRLAPVVDDTRRLLPAVNRTLDGLPPLETDAVGGAKALQPAMKGLIPIFEGVRYYGSDFFLGVVNGLVSLSSGSYNSQGHYLKIEFVQSLQTVLGGALASVIPNLTKVTGGLVPGVFNAALNQNNRCPGGAAPPAPDGSSPLNPREGLCDPRQNTSALVNSPTAKCTDSNTCEGDTRSLKADLPARKPGDDGGVAAAAEAGKRTRAAAAKKEGK